MEGTVVVKEERKHKITIELSLSQINQYGYRSDFFGTKCDTSKLEFKIVYENPQKLPKIFKVLTWNVWGMNKQSECGDKYMLLSELMLFRMEKIVGVIEKEQPDVIVFQEMSYESLGMIKSFMRKNGLLKVFAGYGENFSKFSPDNFLKGVNRDLDIYVFSKYVPKFITQYSQPGNLGYTNPITIISFDEMYVLGCHLQAGSKYSHGQKKVWKEYARCRSEQLIGIGDIIKKECSDRTVILCGDFNMNLDGNEDEWPEVKKLNELKLIDSWRVIYPKTDKSQGFTEDTKINHMRWNMKFIEKQFRYDGILFNDTKLTPIKTSLVGTESVEMNNDMFVEFMRVLGNKSIIEKTRSNTYHPSDHFGVMTTFSQ